MLRMRKHKALCSLYTTRGRHHVKPCAAACRPHAATMAARSRTGSGYNIRFLIKRFCSAPRQIFRGLPCRSTNTAARPAATSSKSLQKFSDAPLSACPACHARRAGQAQVSAAGFQLKGSGWYATDFKGSGTKPAAKSETATASPPPRPTAKSEPSPKPSPRPSPRPQDRDRVRSRRDTPATRRPGLVLT